MRSRAAGQRQFLHQMQEETAGGLHLLGQKTAVQLRTGRVSGLAAVGDGGERVDKMVQVLIMDIALMVFPGMALLAKAGMDKWEFHEPEEAGKTLLFLMRYEGVLLGRLALAVLAYFL